MARLFAWRPALTYRGRKFKGLRGWAGKPAHPPLTDIPVACYLLVGAFDLLSALTDGRTATDLFRAGTYVIIAGAIVSLPTMLTGFWDWLRSTPRHSQAWRTANAHMAVMLTVSALVAVDLIIRLSRSGNDSADAPLVIVSLLVAVLVSLGALYGGSLVYDYAFNVEQDFAHAYEESEVDLPPRPG